MQNLTEIDRDTLREMEQYFTRCVNNCSLGSAAYRRFTLQRVMKMVKEDKQNG